MKVTLGKELHVETPDGVGVLEKVLSAVSKAGSSMQALVAYGESGKGHFTMLTSDNVKAAKALQKLDYTVDEQDVLVLEFEDKKGVGASVSNIFSSAGINVYYTYAGARGKHVVLVANTSDNHKALELLTGGRTNAKAEKKPAKGASKPKPAKKKKR